MCSRIPQRRLLLDWTDDIDKFCRRSEFLFQRRFKYIQIGIFKILSEKLRWNFHGKRAVLKCNRPYRLEPHFELLWFNVALNELQAIVPY